MAKARLLGDSAEEEAQQIHDKLYRDCPWYRSVHDGKNISEAGGGCSHTGKSPEVVPSLVFKGTPETPEASTVDKPTVPPGGPGLFHVKGLHLPPYIQHLWFHLVKEYGKQKAYGVAVGVVKKWAAGTNPGGWKTKTGQHPHTHPDVQAAAQKNVAEWERDRAMAHAHATNTDVAEVMRLAALPAYPKGTMTAPGTRISAQLKHVPSQTVTPSPPLPPGATLPTAAECDALAAALAKDNPDHLPILTGAVKHLHDAGVKLEKNEPIHALESLRGAQMGILASHFELRRNSIPVANVFTAANVPPAAASSAHASMAQSAEDREKFRVHYVQVSKLIDRIRRHHFHGQYGGYATARFTRQDLERMLLRLADEVD
jgi:hypothetical protein